MIKEAVGPECKKADLADLFLKLLHGEKYSKISEKTKVDTLKQVSLAYDVFRRVYYVEVAHFENKPTDETSIENKKK